MLVAHVVRLTALILTGLAAATSWAQPRGGGADNAHAGNSFVVRDVRVFDGRRAIERANVVVRAGRLLILAGNDTPNPGAHGVSMHGELQLLTRAGLTPAEALKAATSGPAEVFGLAGRGRITPGARAGLILVDGNPLSDIKATRAIARVFKNGYDVRRAPVEAAQPRAWAE